MTTIRLATTTDRDAAVGVWEICALTRPWNDAIADFDRALAHEASTILLAEEDGRIVTGQSADTDTVVASVKAYVNALNKLIVRRQKSAPDSDVKSVNYKDHN